MVIQEGFEPSIFALRGRRPWPLDDWTSAARYRNRTGLLALPISPGRAYGAPYRCCPGSCRLEGGCTSWYTNEAIRLNEFIFPFKTVTLRQFPITHFRNMISFIVPQTTCRHSW